MIALAALLVALVALAGVIVLALAFQRLRDDVGSQLEFERGMQEAALAELDRVEQIVYSADERQRVLVDKLGASVGVDLR
jgi:uncharacterized membrane protein